MKIIKLFSAIVILLLGSKMNAQTCTASFVYTLDPNGTITFSNTSTYTPSLSPTFAWFFGDGNTFTTTSVSQSVSTTYTSNGYYTLGLSMSTTILNQCNSGFQVDSVLVMIAGCPLLASYSLTSPGHSVSTVNFASISTGTTGSTTYTWNFGDGTDSNMPVVNHTYPGNGVYFYTLTASNSSTCHSIAAVRYMYDIVGGPTDICAYNPSLSYTIGPAGSVTYTVNGVYSVPGYNHVYWHFGDSLQDIAWNTNPTHIFFNGTYVTRAYYYSWTCGSITLTSSVTITNNPCYANSAYTYTVLGGGAVQFAKTTVSTNSNIAHIWNFGDGITSTATSPTHTYATAGNFSVVLHSYDITYPFYYPDELYYPMPTTLCRSRDTSNINITGIPCVANSNFTISPNGPPHNYFISPVYPYNVTAASWDWGDGSSSNALYVNHTYSAAGSYDICLSVTVSCGGTNSTCVTQFLPKGTTGDMVYVTVGPPQLSTGVDEPISEDISPELFPNPSSGIINVRRKKEVKITDLEIFDLLGNVVQFIIPEQNTDNFKIDLSDLNNGIYFLRVRSPQGVSTTKFILLK